MLLPHPDVVLGAKEVHFFDQYNLPRRTSNKNGERDTKCHFCAAGVTNTTRHEYQQRLRMLAAMIHNRMLRQRIKQLQQQTQSMQASPHFWIDVTPSYLLHSTSVPYYILCSVPWVKLLAILRNPVDRAYSQYGMIINRVETSGRGAHQIRHARVRNPTRLLTFEEWIAEDVRLLVNKGVLREYATVDEFEQFQGSTDEFQAWLDYLRFRRNRPIAAGLYSIQLRHWRRAMTQFDKPLSDLLVLKSEDMRSQSSWSSTNNHTTNDTTPTATATTTTTDAVPFVYGRERAYRRILQHAGLPYHAPLPDDRHVQTYDRPMSDETRRLLHALFRPYNLQLQAILADQGEENDNDDVWNNVWEGEHNI